MFWTLLALLLMVVLGGFISYYGDLQGRRWGKRRVSWFGLRPKYTAVIITSLTGGFIALMSIATVLIASPTVREVVLQGERAIEENKGLNIRLSLERKTTTHELEALKSEIAAYQEKQKADNQKLEAIRRKLEPAQAEIARLEKTQTALQATLTQEQAAIKQKSAELQAKIAQNKRAEDANADLSRQIPNLNRQKERLAAWNRQLEEGNKELQQAKDAMTRVITDKTKEQTTLTHSNGALMEANKQLLSQSDDLDRTNRARQRELESKQAELDRVNGQLARANTQLEQANAQYDQAVARLADAGQTFTQSYHAVRQGEITIRAGAELGRRVLPASLNDDQAHKQLLELLQEASDTAGIYGAGRGDNDRTVRIISKRFLTTFDARDANETASLDALADNIAHSRASCVVVATSINNCIRGEQALVELRPLQLNRIFQKGEVVASRVINAGQSSERVKEAITDFLQQDVRAAAVRQGSIPRVNPITGIKEIGAYDSIALSRLTDKVKRMGGNVLLKAVATAPITSADPLDSAHLRLQSVPAPPPTDPRDPDSSARKPALR